MQLHDVTSASLSNRGPKRVGRGPGSGHGKTSTRGREGATSRSGYAMKVTYEGGQMPLFRRLPKRGFTNGPFKVVYAVVNVGELGVFKAGTKVTREELFAKGILKGNKHLPVKVLGDGELSVSLTVAADRFSKSAEGKIAKAGGSAEWTAAKPKKAAPNFTAIAKAKRLADALQKSKAEPKAQAPKGEKGAKAPKAEKAPKPPKEKKEGDKGAQGEKKE